MGALEEHALRRKVQNMHGEADEDAGRNRLKKVNTGKSRSIAGAAGDAEGWRRNGGCRQCSRRWWPCRRRWRRCLGTEPSESRQPRLQLAFEAANGIKFSLWGCPAMCRMPFCHCDLALGDGAKYGGPCRDKPARHLRGQCFSIWYSIRRRCPFMLNCCIASDHRHGYGCGVDHEQTTMTARM